VPTSLGTNGSYVFFCPSFYPGEKEAGKGRIEADSDHQFSEGWTVESASAAHVGAAAEEEKLLRTRYW